MGFDAAKVSKVLGVKKHVHEEAGLKVVRLSLPSLHLALQFRSDDPADKVEQAERRMVRALLKTLQLRLARTGEELSPFVTEEVRAMSDEEYERVIRCVP